MGYELAKGEESLRLNGKENRTMKEGKRFQALLDWFLLGGIGVIVMPVLVAAQTADAVTYAKDVAPIIQQNCQVCHREGSVAPMTLLTYEDARSFAPLIRYQVSNRFMPPWPLDVGVGIQHFGTCQRQWDTDGD